MEQLSQREWRWSDETEVDDEDSMQVWEQEQLRLEGGESVGLAAEGAMDAEDDPDELADGYQMLEELGSVFILSLNVVTG